jgi:nucleoside-diphosphate-sugar epimerase
LLRKKDGRVSTRIRRAFVTGANGFVGARMVERLLRRHVPVRALVRQRLAGAPVAPGFERVHGDVTRADSFGGAMAGCDVVFHCAWGGESLEDARRINVEGTRHVVEAAARAGVRRIVHLSTMAVHGDALPPELTEEVALITQGDAYGVSKAEGERLALELGRARGLEVVVLRPTLVYGPAAPYWVVGYFERVKHEQVALIDGGTGLANLIFVEDLVDAMWAAAEASGVAGVACLVSGDRPVSWAEYLGHFARMCRKPSPASVPRWRATIEMQVLRVYGTLTQRPRRLQGMDVRLMSQHTAVRIDRARELLGWSPATSLEAGMAVCEAWLRREGHLPQVERPDVDSPRARRAGGE